MIILVVVDSFILRYKERVKKIDLSKMRTAPAGAHR